MRRGVKVGGFGGGTAAAASVNIQDIQYMTIISTGDASDFWRYNFWSYKKCKSLVVVMVFKIEWCYGGGTTTTPAASTQLPADRIYNNN